MIDKAAIEQQLAELPLFQYDWIETSELVFSERVRYICQTQCPMYNTTWACHPAVGTVEECKARCLSYPEAPSASIAPTRTRRAATRIKCSPAWRVRAFWSPTLPKSTVWIS